MSENIDKIIYINLKKREDKQEFIENELNNYELLYERFEAIDYIQQGNVGCSLSHLAVLKLAKERGYTNILILEDDFKFKLSKEDFENTLKQFFDSSMAIEYNVCMFFYYIDAEIVDTEHSFLKRILKSNGTVGYLVNHNYYDRLIQIIEESIPKLIETKQHWNYAIDTCWRDLQRNDIWYGFSPTIGDTAYFISDCTDGS